MHRRKGLQKSAAECPPPCGPDLGILIGVISPRKRRRVKNRCSSWIVGNPKFTLSTTTMRLAKSGQFWSIPQNRPGLGLNPEFCRNRIFSVSTNLPFFRLQIITITRRTLFVGKFAMTTTFTAERSLVETIPRCVHTPSSPSFRGRKSGKNQRTPPPPPPGATCPTRLCI